MGYKAHYNYILNNLAAHLEGTRGTLLCPGTAVENRRLYGHATPIEVNELGIVTPSLIYYSLRV
jgi:hypothetical protein